MSVEKSNEYLDIIKKDIVNHSKSAEDEHDYIINSTARYHGNYVRTCYMPKTDWIEVSCKAFSNGSDR